MAVLRKEKRNNYTVIDNGIFRDRTLSMKAKGLLCQMLSLPDNWDYSIAGLATLVSDGESAVRSALAELKEAGYFRREQVRKDGKIAKIEYIISETKNCEKLVVENPQQENLKQENQPQLNTNKLITKELNKNIHTEFESLWKMYPRKEGKEKARSCYEKARKNGTTYEQVEQGIHNYVNYIRSNGIEKRYVKMGSTFFYQKAWQDEFAVTTGNPFMDILMEGDY